jgi:plasmid stabilization system protein ParE
MKVRLHPEAEAEVSEAFAYFEREEPGLGVAFVRAVDVAIERIVAGPERWPVVRREFRRVLTRKFKYGVVYRVAGDEIEVIAIGDLRRKPF